MLATLGVGPAARRAEALASVADRWSALMGPLQKSNGF